MVTRVITLLLVLILPLYVTGQVKITGTVIDQDKLPLPGVTVVVKGTLRGASTDLDGTYAIDASPDEILVFSMVGMTTREIPVGDRTVIDVALLFETTAIDELVIIGYGAQRARDLTAPIVSIQGEDLNRQVTSGAMQALQGKVAGLQIIGSGVPGRGPTIKIRGVGSIGDYANPLYVVDGVFVDNLDFISSSDIEEITVLKDASASAIYGVRAANGVILVTTKKGKLGKPAISYNGNYGVQIPVNIMKMATRDQYVQLLNEAYEEVTGYIPRDASNYPVTTDWYQELVRTAPMTTHSLDISGTNEKTNYSFGGSYLFQEGIMDAVNRYQRFNIRTRLDQEVNDYLKIGVNFINSRYDQYLPNEGAFFSAYVNPPVYPVYDPANITAYPILFDAPQRYGYGNQYGNPVAAAYYNDNFDKGSKLVFSAYTEFYPVKDKLTFKTSYNQDISSYTIRNYTPAFQVGGSQGVRKSGLTKIAGNSTKQMIDNLLTYSDQMDRHDISILLGQSTRIERFEFLSGSALDVPGIDDQSKYLTTGSFRDRNAADGASRYHGLSFFTRLTYNFDSKYLATLTFRADGSSKYQNKWGYFPSIGLGWNLTREDFMEGQSTFSYLKIRASWGLLGNDNVPANSTVILGQTGIGSSAVFGDVLVDGVGSQTVLQNFLRWEAVSEFNLGTDFAFSNGKLSGDLDLYHRTTDNVVFFAPIATGGGVAELLANNGKVLNAGVELMLSWNNELSENLSYRISFNGTTIYNRVLELEGRDNIPGGLVRGGFTTRTAVGHPIGSFYGFEIDGVFSSESEALLDPQIQAIKNKGFFKYKDQNDDGVIDELDKVYLGSAIPKLIAGIDFGFTYRSVDLSISLYGQLGNKILNAKRMNRDVFADGNYDQDFFDNRWTDENKSDKYPSAQAYSFSYTQQANDFFVEDGSFVRIQNIQAGFTTNRFRFIPELRVYMSAQRPFTFFAYNGFTPEIGGSPINSGIDNTVYPMQSIYSLGLVANF
jgi:TonB-linked SusC/RagA family outer membrane protein